MPGTKTWAVGEEVLAADFNSYVQTQVVATFANAAARDAAITAPTDGRVVWLTDVSALQVRTGAVWTNVPYGFMARASLTADSGSYTNTPAASTATVTVTVPAGGRRLRLSAAIQVNHTVGGPTHERLWIREGATDLATGIQIAPTSVAQSQVAAERTLFVAAGAHTYGIWVATDVGNSNIVGNATELSWLMVEDVGR